MSYAFPAHKLQCPVPSTLISL